LDINKFWIGLITFYQRFISPYKGFTCAHHARHKKGSCSHAVKALIADNGLIKSLPLIRVRFKECSEAYESIKESRHTSDLPCIDLSCDGGGADCGGDVMDCGYEGVSNTCGCFRGIWDIVEWKKRSNRGKVIIVSSSIFLTLLLAYLVYGRGIANVMITDLGIQNQSVLKRFTQRENPEVRVLLIINSEKIYSDIVKLDEVNKEYKLRLKKSLDRFDVDELQVLDARLSVAKELLVVGQELEVFAYPNPSGEGRRFKYRLKRRWHF